MVGKLLPVALHNAIYPKAKHVMMLIVTRKLLS